MGEMRMTKGLAVAAGGALALGLMIAAPALAAPAAPAIIAVPARPASGAAASCTLGNTASSVKHVIYIQFDNTHYSNYPLLAGLGQVYTQIEAAVGEFGIDTLKAS